MSGGTNVQGDKCPGGQMSGGTNVWGDKCPGGKDVLGGHLSRGTNVGGTLVRGDTCPWEQMSWGQFSGGQMSHHLCENYSCIFNGSESSIGKNSVLGICKVHGVF